MELARSEITVNAIVPTAWTQMTASIPIYEPLVARVDAGEPLPREVRQAHAIGLPDDSAALVVFLASDAAANVTGQAIGIGGDRLTMWSHPTEIAAAFSEDGWSAEQIAEELGGDGRRRRADLRRPASAAEPGDSRAMSLDLERLVAIDVHVHAERNAGEEQDPVTGEILAAAAEYFGGSPPQPTAEEVAAHYRERNMAAVLFTVDDEAGMGRRRLGNDEVLEAAAANPDVLIPFASVDPHKGKLGVREARALIERGVRGFKFHPNIQAFWPNDRAWYPLYEVIAEAGLIALFHTGTTGIGAGMPGGGGVHLKYSNPMLVDDVAADFPELDIILAHPSFPWQEEALAIAVHKPNVYIDLSGWSPKYFPEILVRYTNTLLKDKMLFGSDYPLITPDRWLADFAKLEIRDEVRPLVLKENAVRLLGL